MKRSALNIIFVFIIAVSSASVAQAAVSIMKNTKHDLSSGSTASIRSSFGAGTDQICAFCHTPHSSRKDAPLWNRTDVSGPYTVYSSDVLAELTYPSPDQPTTRTSPVDVHVKTRICLSCHDGTIALGNLVNLPFPLNSNVLMQGANLTGDFKLDTSAAGYIGLDLSDDHPVSILYSGTAKDLELNDTIGGTKVRVYDSMNGSRVSTAGATVYVECTSCHDAHDNTNGSFLVESNSGSALCKECHKKAGYIGTNSSVHNSSTTAYNPAAGKLGNTVGEVQCMDCHFPHKAGGAGTPPNLTPQATPGTYGTYLLSFQKDVTCFNVPNRWNDTIYACHQGSLTVPDIQAQVVKQYSHQYKATYGSNHGALEGWDTALNTTKYNWTNNGTSWHVECSDCHNSHTAGNTRHSSPVAATYKISTDVNSPLHGTAGVSVSSYPDWVTKQSAAGYGYIEGAGVKNNSTSGVDYEYQICFKCHSDFAWGGAVPPTSPSLNAPMTNQAVEFGNNGTLSWHPVAFTTGRTVGTLLTTPVDWNASKGSQMMYCSDCHTTNDGPAYPQGPHGSTKKFILSADFDDTLTYGSQGTYQFSSDLCFSCHDSATYLTGAGTGTGFSTSGGTNLHTRHYTVSTNPVSRYGYKCVNCHVRIPHGWNRKAMIVIQNDGAPYEVTTGGALIWTIPTWPVTSGQYSAIKDVDCTTANGCHQ